MPQYYEEIVSYHEDECKLCSDPDFSYQHHVCSLSEIIPLGISCENLISELKNEKFDQRKEHFAHNLKSKLSRLHQ